MLVSRASTNNFEYIRVIIIYFSTIVVIVPTNVYDLIIIIIALSLEKQESIRFFFSLLFSLASRHGSK